MSRKPRLGQANPALSTLYGAPDIQEARRLRSGIVELDPALVSVEGRLDDRLQLEVDGLMASIAQSGQRVPILVRPLLGDRFQLIYGRRRLEACRQLGRNVRAIVTDLDDGQSLRDQLLENLERRDLSFIERAVVAHGLLDSDRLEPSERTNKTVAEILNLTEAGISQLVGVVKAVGIDLIQAIGAADGIGRPRWEDLKKAIQEGSDRAELLRIAEETRNQGSNQAFKAVIAHATTQTKTPSPEIDLPGVGGIVTQKGRGRLRLDITTKDKAFVDWMERNAADLVTELHARWKRSEA